ncbi:hypothetical protein FAIPA1_230093 [Frankia sp. AiPs1]
MSSLPRPRPAARPALSRRCGRGRHPNQPDPRANLTRDPQGEADPVTNVARWWGLVYGLGGVRHDVPPAASAWRLWTAVSPLSVNPPARQSVSTSRQHQPPGALAGLGLTRLWRRSQFAAFSFVSFYAQRFLRYSPTPHGTSSLRVPRRHGARLDCGIPPHQEKTGALTAGRGRSIDFR